MKVLEAELPPEVSGALIKDLGRDPTIMIEQSDSSDSKRFTCAHELGHYIWRSESPNADRGEYSYVDLRRDGDHGGEELFADQFAANLLMPANEVRAIHSKKLPNYALAKHFGVSVEEFGLRLKHLGLDDS